MDLGLKDRVVIVSGGGAGIGGAISETLAEEGAIPVIFARTDPSEEFLARIRKLSPKADWIKADVSRDGDCRAAVEETHRRFGRVYGLVNNAGANDGIGLDAGPEAFRASIDKNLIHYYLLAHLLLDDLKSLKGAIVNIFLENSGDRPGQYFCLCCSQGGAAWPDT